MVAMQHNKLHNLVVTTLGAEMRKKTKPRSIDQEWFEADSIELANLIHQKETLTRHLDSLEARLVRILEEDSDLYDNPKDVAILTLYIDDLKRAVATGITGLNLKILNKESNLVKLSNKKFDDMDALHQEIKNMDKGLEESDEAPF